MNNRNQQHSSRVSSDGRAVRAPMHSPNTANQRPDTDSPSGRDASVATPCNSPTHLNVFTVEEFETNGKKANSWTKIGAAFPIKRELDSA